MRKLLIVGLCLIVGACATFEGKTPQQRVFGAENDFSALLKGVRPFMKLPICQEGQTLLLDNCATQEAKQQVYKAEVDTRTVLYGAENTVRTVSSDAKALEIAANAAVNAVAAFKAILDNRGVTSWTPSQ